MLLRGTFACFSGDHILPAKIVHEMHSIFLFDCPVCPPDLREKLIQPADSK